MRDSAATELRFEAIQTVVENLAASFVAKAKVEAPPTGLLGRVDHSIQRRHLLDGFTRRDVSCIPNPGWVEEHDARFYHIIYQSGPNPNLLRKTFMQRDQLFQGMYRTDTCFCARLRSDRYESPKF